MSLATLDDKIGTIVVKTFERGTRGKFLEIFYDQRLICNSCQQQLDSNVIHRQALKARDPMSQEQVGWGI